MRSPRSCMSLVTSSILAAALAGCGPSPLAHDPPPADPGTVSLRLDDEPVVAFTAPVVCVDGVTAERSTSATSLYCSVEASDAERHEVEILLELGTAASMDEGTRLSTLAEIRLVRAGGGARNGEAASADTASWDGAVTITLGPPASPRTAVLDGALSSVFTPAIAMTFNAVPIELD